MGRFTSLRSVGVRFFGSPSGEPYKISDPRSIKDEKNGYVYTSVDPEMDIDKNPYVEGVAHYRDQLQEEYKDLQFRDYLGFIILLGLVPALVIYGTRSDFNNKAAEKGFYQPMFPDKIPDGGDKEHRN